MLKTIKSSKTLIPAVSSLRQLYNLSAKDKRYEQLMIIGASNLGCVQKDAESSYRWLIINAMETDEAGVVDEVNFCRDLVN